MSKWVRLCSTAELPVEGKLARAEVQGIAICLAALDGRIQAVDNVCPHREAPLDEGWLEGGKLVCPWHSWTFDLTTGAAEFPEGEKIKVFEIRQEGDDVLVSLQDPVISE